MSFYNNNPQISKAINWAKSAHLEQKYNKLPYFIHLESVAKMVALIDPENFDAIAGAYLHDIVEDTHITLAELKIYFDDSIVEIVDLCTDPVAKNRKEKKKLFYARIAQTDNTSARLVKLCDRADNVINNRITGNYEHLKMYAGEHSEFRKAVYRDDEMLQPIQNMLDNLIWNKE